MVLCSICNKKLFFFSYNNKATYLHELEHEHGSTFPKKDFVILATHTNSATVIRMATFLEIV